MLTSNQTFSGGEEFAYDMEVMELAALVGETTGGGANPGGGVQLGSQLSMFMPGGRARNPITGTNWEGVGVSPDVDAPRDAALKVAVGLLGETVVESEINALSTDRLFQPRTTPAPGPEAAVPG